MLQPALSANSKVLAEARVGRTWENGLPESLRGEAAPPDRLRDVGECSRSGERDGHDAAEAHGLRALDSRRRRPENMKRPGLARERITAELAAEQLSQLGPHPHWKPDGSLSRPDPTHRDPESDPERPAPLADNRKRPTATRARSLMVRKGSSVRVRCWACPECPASEWLFALHHGQRQEPRRHWLGRCCPLLAIQQAR